MKSFLSHFNIRLASIIALVVLLILIGLTAQYIKVSDKAASSVEQSLAMVSRLENLETNLNRNDELMDTYIATGSDRVYNILGTWYQKYIRDSSKYSEFSAAYPSVSALTNGVQNLVYRKYLEDNKTKNLRKVFGRDSVVNDPVYQKLEQHSALLIRSIDILQIRSEIILREQNILHLKSNDKAFGLLILLVIFFIVLLILNYLLFKKDYDIRKLAETKLLFNASLIGNISDPIITADTDNNITNWNKYAEKLYGFTEAEVLGRHIRKVLNIEFLDESLEDIKKAYSTKEFWHGELIHHTKEGTQLNVEVNSSIIKNEENEMVGTVAVIRNITDRKIAEAQIRRLTTRLEDEVKVKTAELSNVFDRITDAFIALDNDWRYTYVSAKAAEMHHREPRELLGKVIWELFPDVTYEPFYSALHVAKETQKSLKVTLLSPSSGKWFEDVIYPSPDGLSVYYHDVTEKKLAELELKKAHDKLYSHINNTPLAVVEFSKDYKILQWSSKAEEIFGWKKNEVIGKHFDEFNLVHPDDHMVVQGVQDKLRSVDANSHILINRNINKAGHVVYCEWYNSVLREVNGETAGVLALVQDVTSRQLMEMDLKEAEEKFRRLVEESLIGVFIFQDNKFVYVNPAFNKMFGYQDEKDAGYILELGLSFIADNRSLLDNIESILEAHKNIEKYELSGRHKNGREIYVEIYGTRAQVNGKPAIIGSLVNITRRKNSEQQMVQMTQELMDSNERFDLIAKATKDAIWDWNMEDDHVWGNEIFHHAFGSSNENRFVLNDFMKFVHPEDQERLVSSLTDALKSKLTFFASEFRLVFADSSVHTVNNSAYIVYNTHGRACRMLGAIQDITAQRNYETQILAEKALSDNIINSLPGIFYIYNSEGKLYRWNRNFEDISDYSSAEIESMHPVDFFSDAEAKVILPKISDVFRDGEGNVEAKFRNKKNQEIPYYFTGKMITYEGERCLMGVGIDISDKKLAEEKIQQSEEKFRMLIEQASDGILISDHFGKFTEVNRSAGKITGYSREELMEMRISDLLGKNHMKRSLIAQDELLNGNTILTEATIKHKDGHTITLEVSAKLLPDGRFQGIIRDVSSRFKAAKALKQSENKYRLLFNQNPMPMWMISFPDRKFLDVNPAAIELYGYSREEFLSMTLRDLRKEEGAGLFTSRLHTFKSGIQNAGIWKHKKKNKQEINVNIISHDIVYQGHHAKLILANDVTEKLIAEEKLKKSHEDYRQLASHMETVREAERTNIAREIHDELGQQLTGLKMDISWLKKKINSEDPQVQQKISDTISLIDNTVNSVRKIATELRPSILDDLGLTAAMEWQSEEFQKRSEIAVDFICNETEVEISPGVATQVFRMYQESLTNVLRHSQASLVTATLNIKNNVLILNIADNGKGFNEYEIKEKKTLGLLGMKERAMLLGGSFEVSGKPGKGTNVIIVVPLS